MDRLRRSWIWIGAALVLAGVPLGFDSGYALTILNQMGVLIIFALAYNMLLGQGGMLSFGHAVYFGLAGYATVHFINAMGDGTIPYIPISLVPLLSAVVGLFFGVLIGYVSTRRAGTVFAMISLGFAEMATALTLILVVFFNGEEGIQTDRFVGPEPFGITFGPDIEVYYLIAFWCLASVVAMYALTRTPFGRMCNAVRDNPERIQFIGYNPQRVRWQAFSLSALFAGLAGGLHAINIEHVGFETVGIAQSGLVLFMVYIGGTRHFVGPILGAILITFLNSVLSDLTEAWFLYLGIVFIIIVMFAEAGLAGLLLMHEPLWKSAPRLLRRLAVPYSGAIAATGVAALGLVGLIEMLYFRSAEVTDRTVLPLFGMDVETAGARAWIIFVLVAAAGAVACRATYPRAAASWNDAVATMKARLGP